MWKLAAVIHIIAMTVLMGIAVIVITSIPSLMDRAKLLIPLAAAAGFVFGLPISVIVARKILAQTRGA